MPLETIDLDTLLTELQEIEWVLLSTGSEEFRRGLTEEEEFRRGLQQNGEFYWRELADGVKLARALLPHDPALTTDLRPGDVRNLAGFLDELIEAYRLDAEKESLDVPTHEPHALRARWFIQLVAERMARDCPEPLRVFAPQEEPAKREEANQQQPDPAGQTDTKNDTNKIPGKKRRLLNNEAHDCIRLYRVAKKKDATTTMKSVVEEYVEKNGGSVSGILKRLETNSGEWKKPAQNQH